ncbi:MAG: RNA methyltransferase [Planctomycetaceae bacterium]|nr:RNA methyltransferase [Planctomycetaceae bacterium]
MHDPEYLNFLQQFLTPERRSRFDEVLDFRTRHLTVVLESLHQSNNASACLRSCDAFGIQDVHVIANRNDYKINEEIDMGASYWLTMHKYPPGSESTRSCLLSLKDQGYRIVATSLSHDAATPESLSLGQPVAIVMGEERPGVSETVLDMADEFLQIPMCGFVQSLNVSVATAILLQRLSERLRSERDDWGLSAEEKQIILDDWIAKSVKRQHPKVVQTYLKSRSSRQKGVS